MRLYNTLTRRADELGRDGDVSLYVCGVTPYDTTHLGHARTYLLFDVLVRHLRARGQQVRYVQNITDVDDSILKRAAEVDEDPAELAERYTKIYLDDCAALGMLPPDVSPRATDHIGPMQAMVEALVAAGHAYTRDGDVFFRVGSVDGYGALSGLPRERMLEIEAAQDGTTVDDPRKEDPLDFLLWRLAETGPRWDSPWGPGRPGWHLECSAMAVDHLGSQIDIHGGGSDLIFPHHEAEIAQSEATTDVRPFSRFWVHTGLVNLDGEPMSKSKGNMVFVRDLLRERPADAVRSYLLSTHYREPVDYDEEELSAASALSIRVADACRVPAGPGDDPGPAHEARDRFLEALDDDLDTPRALEELVVLSDAVHTATEKGEAAETSQRTLRELAAHIGFKVQE